MKARYWSSEGRIARGTFWRGILSINLLTFAAFALVIILPVPWNFAAIIPDGPTREVLFATKQAAQQVIKAYEVVHMTMGNEYVLNAKQLTWRNRCQFAKVKQ
jgi:uncharacterized membrane protein YhaH (DUF805 family)